jgi:hypothetical protein
MGAKRQKGQSDDAEIINEAFTGTDAIVSSGDDMREFDSVGAQLIVDYNQTEFSGSDSDSVDDSSKTWTLTEFTFTGMEGATIRVEGSATSDGDYEIDTVTSAHVIVTLTGPGADETFDNALRVTVIRTDDPPAGDWKIEVSNNFVPETNGTVYGQVPNAGDWTDITSQFSPVIAAVIDEDSQYVQADLTARDIRYTFTPSSGQGIVKLRRFCKSWS